MNEKKRLSLDDLENVNGGYLGFTAGSCGNGGEHDWVPTGFTRPASKCNERYAGTHPDKEIRCTKCNKIGWKIFTNDCMWVISYDD
ncbi:MAG: hypothetical protein IJI83_06245 [Oscillospiraceae bacterium]|nr:hypothetical protein [Oscillospiraceae bacterium]MBQ6493353.1 hypothetical protein [Erysipelotrichaceae bacterium]